MDILLPLSNKGWSVPCLCKSRRVARVTLLVDTGAACTLIPYNDIRQLDLRYTGRTKSFVSVFGEEQQLREVALQQFTIERIDMGCCNIWLLPTGNTCAGLLGRDILSRINWDYNHQDQMLKFSSDNLIGKALKEEKSNRDHLMTMCSNIGVSIDKIEPLLPDSWEQLGYDELLKTVRFAWNTFYLNRDKE